MRVFSISWPTFLKSAAGQWSKKLGEMHGSKKDFCSPFQFFWEQSDFDWITRLWKKKKKKDGREKKPSLFFFDLQSIPMKIVGVVGIVHQCLAILFFCDIKNPLDWEICHVIKAYLWNSYGKELKNSTYSSKKKSNVRNEENSFSMLF